MTPLERLVARLRTAGCVLAEEEAALLLAEGWEEAELEERVRRREAGEPLEHVLGWAAFDGLRVLVDPGVFVPRRRTELLVSVAAKQAPPDAVVVDLCCGTGALGLALAARVGGVSLFAADADPRAVACARRNGVTAWAGDLFDALPDELRGRVDVLLANVPYVPTSDVALMPAEARLHEAMVALDGGPDGLDLLRRVAVGAPAWLAPGGRVYAETSAAQAPAALAILAAAGLDPDGVSDEDATVVSGRVTPRAT